MIVCASCLVYVWCVYYVVCFFSIVPVSCDREDSFVSAWFVFVASSVRLLHGLVLLPCGISGKMTATLDLTTIIAMLVASFYRYAALPITYLSSHPKLPWTSNLWHLSYANRCLAILPLCSAPLIELLVAGEVEDFSMVDRILVGISQYLLYY